MSLSNYQKDSSLTYCVGVYPTLELIKHHPEAVVQVFSDPKGDQNTGLAQIKQFCSRNNVTQTIDARLVQKISESNNAYCVAQFKKYTTVLDIQSNHLVLVGPRDIGNLGTIIRTMVGFNFSNLAIIRPAVDIFNPKTIRASMGELFQINFAYFDTFSDYQKLFPRNFYPLMTSAQNQLENFTPSQPFSFVFGNESSGLPDSFASVGAPLKIQQSSQIDSLNLAMSVGITLHHHFAATAKLFSHK